MAGRRVEMGFEGGAIVRLTAPEDVIKSLVDGLGDSAGWRSIDAEEGTYWLNLGELVYLRLVPGEVPSRVGFAGV
jgi:hypothetical protein